MSFAARKKAAYYKYNWLKNNAYIVEDMQCQFVKFLDFHMTHNKNW